MSTESLAIAGSVHAQYKFGQKQPGATGLQITMNCNCHLLRLLLNRAFNAMMIATGSHHRL